MNMNMNNTTNPTQRKSVDEITQRAVGLLVGGLCIVAVIAMLWLRSNQTLGGV